jgi:hypothetical protein
VKTWFRDQCGLIAMQTPGIKLRCQCFCVLGEQTVLKDRSPAGAAFKLQLLSFEDILVLKCSTSPLVWSSCHTEIGSFQSSSCCTSGYPVLIFWQLVQT